MFPKGALAVSLATPGFVPGVATSRTIPARSFSVDAGARSRRATRGGMGTNGAKRSVTVLRAGRGRRTPETTYVCVYVRVQVHVHVCIRVGARRARRCSRCTPTSLCSPVTFAEAACLLPLSTSPPGLLLLLLSLPPS